jgi:hypothetical protein
VYDFSADNRLLLVCVLSSAPGGSTAVLAGFDHGAGHPLLFLDDAKAPRTSPRVLALVIFVNV